MLLDVPIGDDVLLTYATPILRRLWPNTEAFNAGLKRLILAQEQAHPEFGKQGLKSSSAGGWQSDPNVMDWPGPEVEQLRSMMIAGVGQVARLALGPDSGDKRIRLEPQIAAWANINRDGDYNVLHNHPGHHWSGVYYVDGGAPDPAHPLSGVFEFHDPRGGATASPIPGFDFGYKFTVRPQAGMMLIFPSWHLHMVHPFRGGGERVVIAFNIRLKQFQIVDA